MAPERVQTRAPDTLKEQIDEYQESDDFMNQSEAIRALLRAGLRAEGIRDGGADDTDGDTTTLGDELAGDDFDTDDPEVRTLHQSLPNLRQATAVAVGIDLFLTLGLVNAL
jgi:Arc/MetJ-type ribon-helix-helix transcriptional regulator